MSARRGTIKAEIAIPLELPRQQSMMMSSEFLGLRLGLMSLIPEESIKAIGGEVTDLALDGLSIGVSGAIARRSDSTATRRFRVTPTTLLCANNIQLPLILVVRQRGRRKETFVHMRSWG